MILEPWRSANHEAMNIEKNVGAFLSYDLNLRFPLWPSSEEARKGILRIWDQEDLIKVLILSHCVNYFNKANIFKQN